MNILPNYWQRWKKRDMLLWLSGGVVALWLKDFSTESETNETEQQNVSEFRIFAKMVNFKVLLSTHVFKLGKNNIIIHVVNIPKVFL